MKEYIIFGTGMFGRNAWFALKNRINIIGFADSYKKGETITLVDNDMDTTYTVFGLEEIGQNVISVISVGAEYREEIVRELTEHGLPYVMLDRLVFELFNQEIAFIEKLFEDDLSKETYKKIIDARNREDYSELYSVYSDKQYFAITQQWTDYKGKMNFVDAGAYVGDTIERLLFHSYDNLGIIWAFEPGEQQYKALTKRVCRLIDEWAIEDTTIRCVKSALMDKSECAYIKSAEKALPGSYIVKGDESVGSKINVYALDEFFEADRVDFIKADVEGAEINVLRGGKNIILRDKPKLAICIYHSPYDYIQIPLYIHQLRPDYKMAVRHHSLGPYETVLYCW